MLRAPSCRCPELSSGNIALHNIPGIGSAAGQSQLRRGLADQLLKAQLPHLVGVDVSSKSLDIARVRNPEIAYHCSADGRLPFANGSFDVLFAICVWHHVPPDQWATFLAGSAR
jgi:ubiquinone/menaquinone biosynthesis C-methylase UbiE